MDADVIENKEINRLSKEAEAEHMADTQESEGEPVPDQEAIERDEHLNEMFTGTLATISNLVGNMVAPNWNIQPEEHMTVATATVEVIEHYFPNAQDYVGPWAGLGIAVASIAGPRMAQGIPARLPPPEEKSSNDTETENHQYKNEDEKNPLLDPNSEKINGGTIQ